MSMTPVSNDRAAAVRHARRVCGQLGSLSAMIAAQRPLADVAQQVVAARVSLDALLLRLIDLEVDCSPETRSVRGEVDRLLRLALGQARHRPVARPAATGTDR
jgi:DNA-binding FrmR family transcriptional regulator